MRNVHASGAANKAQEDGAMQFKNPDEVEDTGCGNCGQVFGGNVQFNRGGGGGTHWGGGGVQITQAIAGPARRQLDRSTAQHKEGKAGVGAAWEFTLKGGGGAGNIGKVLPCGSSGSDLFWSGDMGVYGTNDAEVRGSTCDFPAASHT